MADNQANMIRKVRRLGLVDLDTGEIIEREVMVFGQRGEVDTGYVKVFVAFLADIVLNKDITGKAIRLLMYIIQKLEWNSLKVFLFADEVIKDLNIHRITYYEWLSILEKNQIIKRVRNNVYELQFNTFVKGSLVEVKKKGA